MRGLLGLLQAFFMPVYTDEKNGNDDAMQTHAAVGEKIYFLAPVLIAVMAAVLVVCALIDIRTDRRDFENNWTVMPDSVQEAMVVSTKLGSSKSGRYTVYTAYITIQTEDGKTVSFASFSDQTTPVAGLKAGDSCTVCIKQYSEGKNGVNRVYTRPYGTFSIKDGDTAYFINDEIVLYQSEQAMSEHFLKDFS